MKGDRLAIAHVQNSWYEENKQLRGGTVNSSRCLGVMPRAFWWGVGSLRVLRLLQLLARAFPHAFFTLASTQDPATIANFA